MMAPRYRLRWILEWLASRPLRCTSTANNVFVLAYIQATGAHRGMAVDDLRVLHYAGKLTRTVIEGRPVYRLPYNEPTNGS